MFFSQIKMEYLGFWVTRNGVKPMNKKVEAIISIKPPNTPKISTAFYRRIELIPQYVVKKFTYGSAIN